VYISGLTGIAQHVKFHLPKTLQEAIQVAVMVNEAHLEEKQNFFLF
jgi:hypothetical protein